MTAPPGGQVRRGTLRGAAVALKGLFLLRTDATSTAAFGGALPEADRRALVEKFMGECRFMQACTHCNIVQVMPPAVRSHGSWCGHVMTVMADRSVSHDQI
jgi:hypothetical protein